MAELIDLNRYELAGKIGNGADYDVRAAVDRETGKQVVLKRPAPQAISRKQHEGIEARTERSIQASQELGQATNLVVPLVGYTDRAVHDDYFGDDLGEDYRVMVEERAPGIPLLGDMMSRMTGVPIAAGQNLFAMFPLVRGSGIPGFPVHNQLLELEEAFMSAGYLLLDLRPQNIFFQPGSGKIVVIDTGALVAPNAEPPRGRPPFDVNDFCLELVKFYTTPEKPPTDSAGYRDARGIRPIINLDQELAEMTRNLSAAPGPVVETGSAILAKIGERSYSGLAEFGTDLNAYLEAIETRNQSLPEFPAAKDAWTGALEWLKEDYWRRFIFDPEVELAGYA